MALDGIIIPVGSAYPVSALGWSSSFLAESSRWFEVVGNVYQICLELHPIVSPVLAAQVTLWLFTCDGTELFDSFFNTACRRRSQYRSSHRVYSGCLLH